MVSRDHVSQLLRTLANDGVDWAMFKAAYKQLLLDPRAQRYAIIALRRPKAGIRHGFRPRTLMFGSIVDVLHYNVCFLLVTAIFNRLFGIPLVCIFDDFAALPTDFWSQMDWPYSLASANYWASGCSWLSRRRGRLSLSLAYWETSPSRRRAIPYGLASVGERGKPGRL